MSKEKPNNELNPRTAHNSAQTELFPPIKSEALYFCICFFFSYSHLPVSTLNVDTEIIKSPSKCIQVLLLIQHEHKNVYHHHITSELPGLELNMYKIKTLTSVFSVLQSRALGISGLHGKGPRAPCSELTCWLKKTVRNL